MRIRRTFDLSRPHELLQANELMRAIRGGFSFERLSFLSQYGFLWNFKATIHEERYTHCQLLQQEFPDWLEGLSYMEVCMVYYFIFNYASIHPYLINKEISNLTRVSILAKFDSLPDYNNLKRTFIFLQEAFDKGCGITPLGFTNVIKLGRAGELEGYDLRILNAADVITYHPLKRDDAPPLLFTLEDCE